MDRLDPKYMQLAAKMVRLAREAQAAGEVWRACACEAMATFMRGEAELVVLRAEVARLRAAAAARPAAGRWETLH